MDNKVEALEGELGSERETVLCPVLWDLEPKISVRLKNTVTTQAYTTYVHSLCTCTAI
jgi:hypothetical protein